MSISSIKIFRKRFLIIAKQINHFLLCVFFNALPISSLSLLGLFIIKNIFLETINQRVEANTLSCDQFSAGGGDNIKNVFHSYYSNNFFLNSKKLIL